MPIETGFDRLAKRKSPLRELRASIKRKKKKKKK